jgi:hypothetical protein
MKKEDQFEKEQELRYQAEVEKFEKAKRLKPEFDKLEKFEEKLKFMDDNFGENYIDESGKSKVFAPSGVGEIRVYPDENKPEEIKLWNEWTIDKIKGSSIEYSYIELREQFKAEIKKIRKSNPFPNDICRGYMENQLKTYSERLKDPMIQREVNFYKGIWDLSKKIITPTFLKAIAYTNYIGYLKFRLRMIHAL